MLYTFSQAGPLWWVGYPLASCGSIGKQCKTTKEAMPRSETEARVDNLGVVNLHSYGTV